VSAVAWSRPPSRRVRAIAQRLRSVYGTPGIPPHGHPIAELVLTVLSQSTNDRNRDVAYARLRDRFPLRDPVRSETGSLRSGAPFPSWEAVRDAPVEEIEAAIRPGGISQVKSRRIQAILRAIGDPLDLDWLAAVPVEEAREFLCGLPGVGRKTAACVLLFTFGARDVPVDTHVGRVGARLALLRAGAGTEELHDEMLAITPPGRELELHVNLLRHGRRTCHAQRPRCAECVLRRTCPSSRV
jgi:endonuclease III